MKLPYAGTDAEATEADGLAAVTVLPKEKAAEVAVSTGLVALLVDNGAAEPKL